ncbi:MAG: CBS domain-containing protein [Candidatus Omnitrophica bacterium]|nr:CBS domain-containing protein [Candidatus Omnitrophota bacterium]MBU0878191.1 CBS domain-containing protein [Candidatus Omnitrophota bacterium]MBU0897439.1 CBS domain-containing protein [Candidatus Omnitrophota bacterium]MBU1133431.1 CBS domain-containing protein [Candidatus Omnitrophota bacterium]MBU1809710.1 CBS domain-containing protein [Candidatus Omnitrophota bacterium]
MKVSDAMKKDIIKVKRSLPLRSLLMEFRDFHTHPLIPVVDDQEHLIGMVYPENLLDLLRPQHAKLFRNIPFTEIDEDAFDLDPIPSMGELIIVDDVMDINFISIKEESFLQDAYKMMRLHKKERLPVVNDENKIVGILGIFDIIWRMFKEKGIV